MQKPFMSWDISDCNRISVSISGLVASPSRIPHVAPCLMPRYPWRALQPAKHAARSSVLVWTPSLRGSGGQVVHSETKGAFDT